MRIFVKSGFFFFFFPEEQTTICSNGRELSLRIEISVRLKVNSIILDHFFATIEKHPLPLYDQLSMITDNCCYAVSIIGKKPSKYKQTWINKNHVYVPIRHSFIEEEHDRIKLFNVQTRCFEKIELKNSSLMSHLIVTTSYKNHKTQT